MCHIVDLKRQKRRLKVRTDKLKLKVKMQSVQDDDVALRWSSIKALIFLTKYHST